MRGHLQPGHQLAQGLLERAHTRLVLKADLLAVFQLQWRALPVAKTNEFFRRQARLLDELTEEPPPQLLMVGNR